MGILSTSEICEKLGVSRAWVNNHLRSLGGIVEPENRDKANIRTVYYSETELISWLNEHATFSRQTMRLDLCDFASEGFVRNQLKRIEEMPTDTEEAINYRDHALYSFLKKIYPPEVKSLQEAVDPRERGRLPWVQIDHKVEHLEDLQSIKDLQKLWSHRSAELTYRTIFSSCMIRVEVCGRCWYMSESKRDLLYPITVPACYEK